MPRLNMLYGCRTLQLTRGFNTLIDEDDFEKVACLKWNVERHERLCYARRLERDASGKMKALTVHRLVMDAPPGIDVDHRNGDGLDNRKVNLRLATTAQNMQNKAKYHGASKFKGVCKSKNRWRASICLNGKVTGLGHFRTQEEAARAYDAAALKNFGSFARTNTDLFGQY